MYIILPAYIQHFDLLNNNQFMIFNVIINMDIKINVVINMDIITIIDGLIFSINLSTI